MTRIAQLAHTKSIFVWINHFIRGNIKFLKKLSIRPPQPMPNHPQFTRKGR